MTKSEAYNKLMSFKSIFPSASKEIDEMYEALTSNDNSKEDIDGIKEAQRILGEYPSEGANKAYCVLNKALVESGDYDMAILNLLWAYGTYDEEIYMEYNGERDSDYIKLGKPIVGRNITIDKVYILDNEDVVLVSATDNKSDGLELSPLFSSLDDDLKMKVYEEVKRTISKSIFESKLVDYVTSLRQYDGVGYELCLEECITLIYNKEETNIIRFVVENHELVCHALNGNDETIFITFDELPFKVQEEIYDMYLVFI